MINLRFVIEASWGGSDEQILTVEECFNLTDKDWESLSSEERHDMLEEYAKELYEAQYGVFYSLEELEG